MTQPPSKRKNDSGALPRFIPISKPDMLEGIGCFYAHRTLACYHWRRESALKAGNQDEANKFPDWLVKKRGLIYVDRERFSDWQQEAKRSIGITAK